MKILPFNCPVSLVSFIISVVAVGRSGRMKTFPHVRVVLFDLFVIVCVVQLLCARTRGRVKTFPLMHCPTILIVLLS